jgi:hypothetical protein
MGMQDSDGPAKVSVYERCIYTIVGVSAVEANRELRHDGTCKSSPTPDMVRIHHRGSASFTDHIGKISVTCMPVCQEIRVHIQM